MFSGRHKTLFVEMVEIYRLEKTTVAVCTENRIIIKGAFLWESNEVPREQCN